MPPPNHASPLEQPDPSASLYSLRRPKTRISVDNQSMASSVSTLQYRASNASVSSLFASTSTPGGSRSVSPSGASTPSRILSGSVFGGPPVDNQKLVPADRADDPRNLILQAFVPHIAVHTSIDTQELIREKGFDGGLWELLRPFGERIQGKVTVRDSIGAGRTWDDFAVRFVQMGDGLQVPEGLLSRRSGEGRISSPNGLAEEVVSGQRSRTGGDVGQIESLVDQHLSYAEHFPSTKAEDHLNLRDPESQNSESQSRFYTLYLRRLLSGIPLTPHETFSHPVACIIAISSRNTSPIEALRRLYDESSYGEKRLPLWVNNEYLRYYVLVHDEERDDISKSITLFEQMKRHFGLHCHLLRLRSSRCVVTDDDAVQLPQCDWMAAAEESALIQLRENEEDGEDSSPYIYESDTTAIKTFIREMVTQSVIPSMERCVSTWNDQVASRRRGIGGRIMNLSKKWAGFGSSSRNSSTNGLGASSNTNYDALQGFYRPDAPEAIMRKLADYAFMLRDWKLAQSTYDLLRSDFSNDKAWRYHAAANEMAAISMLLIPAALSSRTRAETIDQMLETSSYSYITRCRASYGAARSLMLGMELLKVRGGSATDDAARWGARLLEYKVVGDIGDALIKERVAACYSSKKGAGSGLWGARTRKSAWWSIQATDTWLILGKGQQAKLRWDEANNKYATLPAQDSISHFSAAFEFMQGIERDLEIVLNPASGSEMTITQEQMNEPEIEEESEAFDARPHRRSLMGGATALPLAGLGSAPLQGTLEEGNAITADNFERD
ncbi:hypothetical protein B7494_g4708 [Chlorociboria aeruginascens]|nr:hypothetical protein B7494_g4708 [Chlorociboria aeruginascens]